MTSNHPIFMSDGNWKMQVCVAGTVMILGNVCKRCGKPTHILRNIVLELV